MNWLEIAKKCNTTPGAASKRYSRMKQAFEKGVPPPGTTTSAPNTPAKKIKASATSGEKVNASPAPTPTPKRKRSSPKKKAAASEEQDVKPEPEDDNTGFSDEESKPKRKKAVAGKTKPKGKANGKIKTESSLEQEYNSPTPTTEATTLIKGEDNDDTFYKANEDGNDLSQDEGEKTADRKYICLPCACVSSFVMCTQHSNQPPAIEYN